MLNKPYQPTVADVLAITKLNMHTKLLPYRNFHKPRKSAKLHIDIYKI
jgi:hypothetical protein